MKKHYFLVVIFHLFLCITSTFAQPGNLVSPCIGTFSRNSLLFDLQALNNIVLDDIAILSQNCGTRDFKVYYKQGTYLGFNSNPAVWTLLDSTQNFTPNCALACPIPPSVIPVNINLCLTAGQTYGFYIAMTGGTGTIESHNISPSGSTGALDANLRLITGEGHSGNVPFNVGASLVTGLTMQGEFHYHVPQLSLGNDTTICNGDSILLNPGNLFSTFQWSNGLTSQSVYISNAGTYAVLVDSGSCQATDTITVSAQSCSGIAANMYSSDTSFCDKKCLDFFDLSTNNPTSWLWLFPGADSLSSTLQNPTGICYSSFGSFDVTLIACNATGCDTLFLPGFVNEFQPPPVPVITSSNDTLFSTPSYLYQWHNGSGSIPGATSSFYVYQVPGLYYVIVTDSNGCATSSSFIYTSIEESTEHGNNIHLFPNPTTGDFSIVVDFPGNDHTTIEIRDGIGRIVRNKIAVDPKMPVELSLENITDGIYVVKIENGSTAFIKLVLCRR